MKFPNQPEFDTKKTLNETIINLLQSIAKEEEALASLLQAESKKIEAFVGINKDFPTSPTNQEILQFSLLINQVVDTVLMKEWLLYRKAELALQINSKNTKDHQILDQDPSIFDLGGF